MVFRLSFLFALLLWNCHCAVTTVQVVDPFSSSSSLTANSDNTYVATFLVSDSILGLERDFATYVQSDVHSLPSNENLISCDIRNGAATVHVMEQVSCGVTFQYDGMDFSMKLNTTSMAPVDFYEGDSSGIRLGIFVENTCQLLLFIETDQGSCTYNSTLRSEVREYLIDWRYFITSDYTLCNLTSVRAIELNLLFNTPGIASMTSFATYKDSVVPTRFDSLLEPSVVYSTATSASSLPLITPSNTVCCATTIVGGQRDHYVEMDQLSVAQATVYSNISHWQWYLAATDGVKGKAVVQYDGFDQSINLVMDGLGELDFSANGQRNAFLFRIDNSQNSTVSGAIEVYCDGISRLTTAHFLLNGTRLEEVLVPFSSFSPSCDMTAVGSLEIVFFVESKLNLRIWDMSIIHALLDVANT